tara:strand:- start:175 stop:732 length:558 start_codon:yes stop_codon:yes gene_type:complete
MGCLQRIVCCGRDVRRKKVYVLKLENQKYYVGESSNIRQRIWAHENGGGSAWSKKYKYIRPIKLITKPQDSFWELSETLEQMYVHGINNVRGSMFTKPFELSKEEKIMAAQLYCEKHNLCRNCGEPGHFINQCKNEKVAPWVKQFGGLLNIDKNSNRICNECSCDINHLPKYFKYCNQCYKNINI